MNLRTGIQPSIIHPWLLHETPDYYNYLHAKSPTGTEKEKDRERDKAEGKERERERAKYVLAVMNRLWRVECRRCIGEGVGVTANNSSGSGSGREGASRRGGSLVIE